MTMHMEEIETTRTENVHEHVGAAMKKLREYRGFSIEQAAALMGIRDKKLMAIERGTLYGNLNVLSRYIEALGGKLAIVPTDNAGVTHCDFITLD